MKVILSFMLSVIVCRCSSEHKTLFEGTYVTHWRNEFSEVWDTLTIQSYARDYNTYTIEHRSGYHRIRNGVPLPKEFDIAYSLGVLDQTHGQLIEQRDGKLYTFSSANNAITIGNKHYNKID